MRLRGLFAIWVVGLGIGLSGCAHKTLWFRENLTQQQFSQDSYACVTEVNAAGKGNWSFGPVWWVLLQQSAAQSDATKMYELCMRARGYEPQEASGHTPEATVTATTGQLGGGTATTDTSGKCSDPNCICTGDGVLVKCSKKPWP